MKLMRFYTFLIFLFLYAPMLVMILYSFNDSASTTVFNGLSVRWYEALLEDESILQALKNTLVLAITSALISTVIGTVAAVGLDRWKKSWLRGSMMTVTNIPMTNPEIVTGISMMLLFVFAGGMLGKRGILGFGTLLIAHITFSLPYVILSVLPKLRQTDRNLAEAAQDLGCRPFQAFYKVVLPAITPGIITGMIMAFTMSLDDFVISYFTTGPGYTTLPIAIFSMTRKRVRPTIFALSSLIFISVLLLLLLVNAAQARSEKKRSASYK